MMKRREFLSLCGGVAAASMVKWSWASDLPSDIKITRIVGFDLVSRRDKLVGKNSRLGVHGSEAWDPMIRVFTDKGFEGLGRCWLGRDDCSKMLGKNPFEFFNSDIPAFDSPLGANTMALWDLAGKVQKKPVYQLLGAKGGEKVAAYDGTIYFADLLPEYENNWRDRFKEEIDMGLAFGHRAFKIKIGRGAKWMPTEEGFERDKEVVKLIREHAGADIALGVDANNGYDLERTKRFLTELSDVNFEFIEEMFEENVGEYLELKKFMAGKKFKIKIADGETQGQLEPLIPFMKANAIDIYQLDTNHFGIEGIMDEVRHTLKHGQVVAPHNWASLIGFYTTLQIGRGIPNMFRAENDLSSNDIVIADGYTINDGLASVPERAGFGLKINESTFASKIKPKFDIWT